MELVLRAARSYRWVLNPERPSSDSAFKPSAWPLRGESNARSHAPKLVHGTDSRGFMAEERSF